MSASGSAEKTKKKSGHGRHYVQLMAAVLYNCNVPGIVKGSISQGKAKGLCVPGLNCYSCPGAVAACPLGSLQSALVSAKYRFPYYILGTLLLFGLLFGRLICGFLCPFGFLQDLLGKLPVPKLKKSRLTAALSWLKYAVLLVFAIALPLLAKQPGFCKYICPAGTLGAGIPQVLQNEVLRPLLGFLFSWKVALLALILILCSFCHRAFCRFLCPLGAFYSLFNPLAFFGIKVDAKKCIGCGKCVRVCKMDIKKVCDRECIHCGECIGACPTQAISYGLRLRDESGKGTVGKGDDEISS
ncbi:MAG: 4Fe-4S binding protein [Lachnospiraceae bacterium]|nr:4Fe-4S binding protein [Lachnospiraceae bacterium]